VRGMETRTRVVPAVLRTLAVNVPVATASGPRTDGLSSPLRQVRPESKFDGAMSGGRDCRQASGAGWRPDVGAPRWTAMAERGAQFPAGEPGQCGGRDARGVLPAAAAPDRRSEPARRLQPECNPNCNPTG
jgi:hypothetical protein